MVRKSPLAETVRRLYIESGNQCAFPSCKQCLWEEDTNYSEIAHIEAAEKEGPRYNEDSNDEERREYANLIPMCPTHHTIIDKKANLHIYTVEYLKEIKSSHIESVKQKVQQKPPEPPEIVVGEIMDTLQGIYSRLDEKTEEIKNVINTRSDGSDAKIDTLIAIVSNNNFNCDDVCKLVKSFVNDYSIEEALKIIEDVIVKPHNNQDLKRLSILKLDCLIMMHKGEEAKAFLENELLINKDLKNDLDVIYQKARILAFHNENTEARKICESILAINNNHRGALILLIDLRLHNKEFTTCEDALSLIPLTSKEYSLFKLLESNIYHYFQRYDKSITLNEELYLETDDYIYSVNYFRKVLDSIKQPINRILGMDKQQSKILDKCLESILDIENKFKNKSFANYADKIFEIKIEILGLQRKYQEALGVINQIISQNEKKDYKIAKAQTLIHLNQLCEAKSILEGINLDFNDLFLRQKLFVIKLQIAIDDDDWESAQSIFNDATKAFDSNSLENLALMYLDFALKQSNDIELERVLNFISKDSLIHRIKTLELYWLRDSKSFFESKEYNTLIDDVFKNIYLFEDLEKILLVYFFQRIGGGSRSEQCEKLLLCSVISFECNNEFLLRFIELSFSTENIETVLELIESTCKSFPEDIKYFKYYIKFLFEIGGYQHVTRLIEESNFKDDFDLSCVLTDAYLLLNNKKAAKHILKKEFNTKNLFPNESIGLANMYCKLGEDERAKEIIKRLFFSSTDKKKYSKYIVDLQTNYWRTRSYQDTKLKHVKIEDIIYLKFSNEHMSKPYLVIQDQNSYLHQQNLVEVIPPEFIEKVLGQPTNHEFTSKKSIFGDIKCKIEKIVPLMPYIITESLNNDETCEKGLSDNDPEKFKDQTVSMLKALQENTAQRKDIASFAYNQYLNGKVPIYILAKLGNPSFDLIDIWLDLSKHSKIVISDFSNQANQLNTSRKILQLNCSKIFILDFLSLLTLFTLDCKDQIINEYQFKISGYLLESLHLIIHQSKAFKDSHLSVSLGPDDQIIGFKTEPKTKKIKFLEALLKWITGKIPILDISIPHNIPLEEFNRISDDLEYNYLASSFLMATSYRENFLLVSDDMAFRDLLMTTNSFTIYNQPLFIPVFLYDLYLQGKVNHSTYFRNIEILKAKNYSGLKQIYLCEVMQ